MSDKEKENNFLRSESRKRGTKRGESSGIRFSEEARVHSLELQRNVKKNEVKA